jgi:hypothetical protein
LLRKRSLGRGPRLVASLQDGQLVVNLRHNAETQIADLVIALQSEQGAQAHIDPSGAVANSNYAARTRLVVYASGQRAVELWNMPLPPAPPGDRWTAARAVLRNPWVKPGSPWADASAEAVVELP